MGVPKEILAIERPKNTVVVPYGRNKDYYAVRARVGCKYDGGRRLPINGGTIGHIIDGCYVPIEENPVSNVSLAQVDIKDWACVILCDRLSSSLLDELQTVYSKHDALTIYCSAILRVSNPGIKDYELKDAYEDSFLSEIYPGVALSKNTLCAFWNNLGKAYSKICLFMTNRVNIVEKGHHVLVDGTLKSDESKVNSLSDYSRKARTKGTRDISVLYAYDLEAQEPICSKCFPGNMLDCTAYDTFISENHILKGIIVGDKGFPSSAAKKQFAENKDLHYLNPLKRDSRYIELCDLLEYEGQLPGHETILYKKAKVPGQEKWLYSFKDAEQAHKEDYTWLHKKQKDGKFDNGQYREDWMLFGTIVLESDLDMEPSVAYASYDSRWEIELVMRYYKQTCEFDETRVHDDYSVIGSEFCNFLSSVITYRLLNAFEKNNLFDKMNYKQIMHVLKVAKQVRVDGKTWLPKTMSAKQTEVLQKLDMFPKPVTKRRGRPPKVGV